MRIGKQLIGALLLLTIAAASGCGTPGAPLPPSLELPTPVKDLAATRKGRTVVLTWTPSQRTTDKQNIRRAGPTRVCRVAGELSITGCTTVITEIDAARTPKPTNEQPAPKMVIEDPLPASLLSANGFATYAVEVMNRHGRSAGLSNQVRIPLAPTWPPPDDLSAMVTAEGVIINWKSESQPPASPSLRYSYQLFRRPAGENNFVLVEELPLDAPIHAFADRSFQWEHTYEYKITPVTEVVEDGKQVAEVEGEDSRVLNVTARDNFPPAQSSGVQAVFSGAGQTPFIDLTWAPNMESDIAGYNVFRREHEGTPLKLNRELIPTPAFRDSSVQKGKKYLYSVQAVDLRGNTGQVSAEAAETVPQ